jgi:hypothetical protein
MVGEELYAAFFEPSPRLVLARAALQPREDLLAFIHLASALLARRRYPVMIVATHDGELATAAGAMGLRVIGAPPPRR